MADDAVRPSPSPSPSLSSTSSSSVRRYDWFVMLTFEPIIDASSSGVEDIVELAWTRLNVRSLEIADPVQYFVRPEKEVSDERIERLSLSKEMLEEGLSLENALQKLNSDLYLSITAKDNTFCIVSANAQDVRGTLFGNAAVSSIKLAPHFHRYFDLLAEFKRHFTASKAANLRDMCNELHIAIDEEQPFRCVDAVRCMAQITSRLLVENHTLFSSATVLPDDFDPFAVPSASSSSEKTNEKPPSRYVWARGFPWQTTLSDVRSFFSGLSVDQVLFNMNSSGRMTGEAHIAFASPEDAQDAISKFNRQTMGHRYIEIFPSSQVDFEHAQQRLAAVQPSSGDREGSSRGPGPLLVRLRGLPYSVRESDVVEFFHGIRIPTDGITIVRFPDGRLSGEGFVQFESEADLTAALGRHKERLGNRYIEIFKSNADELRHAHSSAATGGGSSHRGDRDRDRDHDRDRRGWPTPAVPTASYPPTPYAPAPPPASSADPYGDVFVKLRGLPFSCTSHDVMQFFATASLTPIGIQILQNAQGRPSGEAFVQFATSDEARRALSRHRGFMGQRYIEVFPVTAQEVIAAVGYGSAAAAAAPQAPYYGRPPTAAAAYPGYAAPYAPPPAVPTYGSPYGAYGAPAAQSAYRGSGGGYDDGRQSKRSRYG